MAAARAPLGERLHVGQGPEFAALVQALDHGIIVRDRDDQVVYANRAAARGLDCESPEELIGATLGDLLGRLRVLDADGRPVTREAIPSAHLMPEADAGSPPEPLLVQTIPHAGGEMRWYELRASALHDDAGAVAATVTVISDVTAVRIAEIHTEILATSGRLLSSSLDYQQTLRNVAGAAVPGLADWCLVELMHGAEREQVVVAHVDPEQEQLARRLRTLEPSRPTTVSALHRVLRSGEPELLDDIDDAHLRRMAVSDEQLELYRALGIRSALVVPMTTPTRTIGALTFFTSTSGRRFRPEDVALAEQLGRRAAVAVDNARLHTTMQDVAQTLQRSLLPAPIPDVPGWEIGAMYRPAREQPRIEVGGDFYEVFETAGSAFATIGDVTGHGVQAATVTSLLRYGGRFASHLEPDPVAIIRRLDEELARRQDGPMASALCAALHDHSLLLCSAGHPPALVVGDGGAVREAPASAGPLLGAFDDGTWHQERVALADGELVLLYTDGVTETAGREERYGGERLARFLADHAGSAPQPLLDALDAELIAFGGGAATDDVAALALRPQPRRARADDQRR